MAEILGYTAKLIAPAGRNKYGNYYSAGNITKSVINTTYGGNNTTTTLVDNNESSGGDDNLSFYCMLSKPNVTFDAIDLTNPGGARETTDVIAYRGFTKAPTFIMDFDQVTAVTEDGIIVSIEAPADSGITDIPNGITITVSNNGTSAATITINATSTLTGTTGTINIPVVIYKRDKAIPQGNDLLDWWDSKEDCEQVWLEFVWNVNRAAVANYTLDLSNQMAGVNCDSAGTLYSNSIATLQCTATTYYNGEIAEGITYSASTQAAYAAHGYSINANTGVMTFTSAGTNQFYWAPAYPSLPIDIIAIKDGEPIATKTMTINRNYPGTDGTPAHTRYIVTDYDVVRYDPNTSAFTPTQVVGRVMLQVGDQLPAYDSSTTIYQWYNDLESGKASAQGSITANTYTGIESITFALKNSDDEYFEVEEVPVISQGKDGTDGQPGEPGTSGESAWHLTLTNDNASINCDSEGNILPSAVRPTCRARLYHGSTRQTSGITYRVNYGGASGITSGVTSGVLSLSFGSSFNFTGSSVAITISASTESTLRDVKVMNVTKSYAGDNGDDAVSYWLEVSYGEVIYDPNTSTPNPERITAAAYKQVGQQAVVPAADAEIYYSWQSRSTGGFTTESAYTQAIQITSGDCETYSRLRFVLYTVGDEGVQVDQEDVDIMMNGADGQPGQGRTGAALRGPYDWNTHSGSTQCWCAGESGTSCSDCEKWIDVILKDGTYYYCTTTYYGSLSPWNSVSQYWTSGDTFDFVAANLILAPNGSIDFLTGQEIYLRNSRGEITAGAAGGNGINFWAGADTPGDAPFTVSNDGTMVATQGTFGPFTIGYDTEQQTSKLSSEDVQDMGGEVYTHSTILSPTRLNISGEESGDTYSTTGEVSVHPLQAHDTDACGLMSAEYGTEADDLRVFQNNSLREINNTRTAICTNAMVTGTRFMSSVEGEDFYSVSSPQRDIKIEFMTDNSSNFTKAGNWFIDGYDTGIPAVNPQSLFRYNTTTRTMFYDKEALNGIMYINTGKTSLSAFTIESGGTMHWFFNGTKVSNESATDFPNIAIKTSSYTYGLGTNVHNNYNGEWIIYNSTSNGRRTGIQSSQSVKRNNVIYIEI